MKSFKEYLTESKRVYEFKVKIAGNCPKDCASQIKTALSQFHVESCSAGKSTPIQETQKVLNLQVEEKKKKAEKEKLENLSYGDKYRSDLIQAKSEDENKKKKEKGKNAELSDYLKNQIANKGKGKPMTEEEYKLNKQLFSAIETFEPQFSKKDESSPNEDQ